MNGMNEAQMRIMKNKFMEALKTGNNPLVDKYVNDMGKIDINLAEEIECEKCGSKKFEMFNYLKKIPEISSPSGHPVIIPIQAFACKECAYVNKDFALQEE